VGAPATTRPGWAAGGDGLCEPLDGVDVLVGVRRRLRWDGGVLAAEAAKLNGVDAVVHRAGPREVDRAVVAVQFQPVELPGPVGRVETRSQPDDRAVGELQGRLDVTRYRR